jgi:hypothetical protein
MFGKTRLTAVVLGCAAVLATGGIASAATYMATTSATITVCVHHSGGGLYRAAHCAAHDSKLSWNVQGPRGPAGVSLFARVDENGGLHEHSAGVTASKDSSFTGVYRVFFPQKVSKCVAVASQGQTTHNGFIPGTLFVADVQSDPGQDGNPREVDVFPTDTAGTPRNAPFDLIVAC